MAQMSIYGPNQSEISEEARAALVTVLDAVSKLEPGLACSVLSISLCARAKLGGYSANNVVHNVLHIYQDAHAVPMKEGAA